MSVDTFSYVILKTTHLRRLIEVDTEGHFDLLCLASDFERIKHNINLLILSNNRKILSHSYIDDGYYNEINFFLRSKDFSYRCGRTHSKVKISLDQYDQHKYKLEEDEIVARLYFPSFWGTDFSEIIEQKNEVINLIAYLQPEFGFSTNENEIEKIYELSNLEILDTFRDWVIISTKDIKYAKHLPTISVNFKNSLTLDNLLWLDNL